MVDFCRLYQPEEHEQVTCCESRWIRNAIIPHTRLGAIRTRSRSFSYSCRSPQRRLRATALRKVELGALLKARLSSLDRRGLGVAHISRNRSYISRLQEACDYPSLASSCGFLPILVSKIDTHLQSHPMCRR